MKIFIDLFCYIFYTHKTTVQYCVVWEKMGVSVMLLRRALLLLALSPLILTLVPLHHVAPFDGFDSAQVRGQRVLVCGASGGLGEQMAYQYAKLGARLVLVARREAELEKVAEEARRLGAASAVPVVGDMADDASVARTVSAALDSFGGDAMDVLVLNHAMQYWGWFLGDFDLRSDTNVNSDGNEDTLNDARLGRTSSHVSFASIDKMVRVNYLSFVKLATLATPALARGALSRQADGGNDRARGRIIVVSSGGGKVTVPLQSLYSGAKHALHGFFDSFRLELEHKLIPVTVTNIVLGATATEKFTSNTQGTVAWPPPCPTDEAAEAIVRAGEVGLEERYYPLSQTLHVSSLLRSIVGVRWAIDRLTLLTLGGRNMFLSPFL